MGRRLARPARARSLDARALVAEERRVPHRDRYLFVCTNRREDANPKGSCAQKGSEALVKALKEALLARGLLKSVRACGSACLDLCESGISIVQEPDHVAYGGVTPADVPEIVDAVARGDVVERLVIHDGRRRP